MRKTVNFSQSIEITIKKLLKSCEKVKNVLKGWGYLMNFEL